MPKQYPAEIRERAVRLVREAQQHPDTSYGAPSRIAQQLGINADTLRGWLKQADMDGGARPGVTTSESARIAELERENRELKRANQILKSASVDSTGQRNTIENVLRGVMWQRSVDQDSRRIDGSKCGICGRQGHQSARSVEPWAPLQAQSSRSCYLMAGSISRLKDVAPAH